MQRYTCPCTTVVFDNLKSLHIAKIFSYIEGIIIHSLVVPLANCTNPSNCYIKDKETD